MFRISNKGNPLTVLYVTYGWQPCYLHVPTIWWVCEPQPPGVLGACVVIVLNFTYVAFGQLYYTLLLTLSGVTLKNVVIVLSFLSFARLPYYKTSKVQNLSKEDCGIMLTMKDWSPRREKYLITTLWTANATWAGRSWTCLSNYLSFKFRVPRLSKFYIELQVITHREHSPSQWLRPSS
jgi:hypothetical protein